MNDPGLSLHMNWVDLVIIGVAIGIGLWGWRLGIVRASVALTAIIVGVLLAGQYHESVFIDLAIHEDPSGTMLVASFLAIVGLVAVGGYIAGSVLRSFASLLLLGWADRAAGGLFGILFGLLLAQAAIAIVVLAGLDDAQGVIGDSLIGWVMLDNVPVVRALLPDEFDNAIQQFVGEVDDIRQAVEGVQGVFGGG